MHTHPEINIYECFAEAFQTHGYPCQTDGNSFCFLPLDLHFTGVIEDLRPATETIAHARVFITATHAFFPEGIREYGYGWAATETEAVVNAIERWIESDFPPIHDFLCASEESKKTRFELASVSGETGEYLAWNLFLGPLLKLGTGDLETDTTDKMALFKVLLDSMTGDLLGRRGVYPIRCFASKHADTGIDVDCRINGADWERGRYDLYMHAESWQAETGFLAWKQYMLIVPVEAEDLESDSLRESLKNGLRKELQELQQAERQAQTEQQAASPEQKKKWWRFWD